MPGRHRRRNVVWQVIAFNQGTQEEMERHLRQHGFAVLGRNELPSAEQHHLVREAIRITPRQREVLEALLIRDHSEEIARSLGISTKAVNDIIQRLEESFGVSSRHRLVWEALVRGMIGELADD
jgi:DNA-binding CsgD family transcriptional regulator